MINTLDRKDRLLTGPERAGRATVLRSTIIAGNARVQFTIRLELEKSQSPRKKLEVTELLSEHDRALRFCASRN